MSLTQPGRRREPHAAPCPGPQAHVTKQGHQSCVGHCKTKGGMPCPNAPNHGERVCRMHGSSGRSKAKAARVRAEAEALAAVELFAARRDIEPGQALLELVQWTAGEVDYWRQEVRKVERAALTWGVTREKTGGSNSNVVPMPDESDNESGTRSAAPEVTREAKPHIAYAFLVDAQNRLAQYCVAAIKAGVAERQIRLAEQQGALLADVIRAILADLHLTKAQQALVAIVVPAHLRAITGGAA